MNQQDSEVANIYEQLMKGQKNAIQNLQKLTNSPKIKSNKQSNRQTIEQQTSQSVNNLNDLKKSQNFRKYLRDKVTEMKINKQDNKGDKNKIDKQDNKQFAQPKPFPKTFKRSEVRSEQKVSLPQAIKKEKQVASPSTDKIKTASNNFQQKINKNIVKDTNTQKNHKQTPPSSKQSFRIRTQGGNKKLLEELMKLNDQQRRLQSQILHLHTDTKQQIAAVFQKYRIKQLDKNYVQVGMEESLDNLDSPSTPNIKGVKSAYIKSEQSKIQKLKKEINALSAEIQAKKSEIAKKQARIDIMPLVSYLNAIPDIYEERQSEQQAEQMPQLPQNQDKKADPSKTYQNLMVQKRKKNWGLNQRFNYEYDNMKNTSNAGQKDLQKSPPKSKQPIPQRIQDGENNKIIVNQRLKQFLFE